jgi:hypothetical protein
MVGGERQARDAIGGVKPGASLQSCCATLHHRSTNLFRANRKAVPALR